MNLDLWVPSEHDIIEPWQSAEFGLFGRGAEHA